MLTRFFLNGFPMTLIIGMILLSSCASSRKKEAKQSELHFGAGTQSLIDQQYTEALTSLLKANELDPNNSEIINNLGMAYYFKGEETMALKHLREAIKLKPGNSDAKVNLASILFQKGDIKAAENLYREVLKDLTYDKQARNMYNLGVLEWHNKKNVVEAEKYFLGSLKEDENYCPSYFQLGLINYSRRQFKTALKNFRDAAMGTCYNSPAAHYYQALSMTELRQFTEARLKFDEIDSRFKRTSYAVKARTKAAELTELERRYNDQDSQASRKVLETPEF